MTPRRLKALIIPLFMLIAIPYMCQSQKLFVQDVRHNRFFIISQTGNTSPSGSGTLYKNGKKIGQYRTIMNRRSRILCEMDSDQPLLDDTCYILNTPESPPPLAHPNKNSLPAQIQVDQFLFVKTGNKYLSSAPISLNRIGSIENLPGYLESIEKKIQSRFRVSIPKAREIKQYLSHIKSAIGGKFIVCNFQNRLGYAYMEEDELITRPVLKKTVNKLKNKFFFYIILK